MSKRASQEPFPLQTRYKDNRSDYAKSIPFGSTTRRELFTIKDEKERELVDLSLPMVSGRSIKDISRGPERRYFETDKDVPGPADYSGVKEWRISKSQPRRKVVIKRNSSPESSPGPAEYTIPECMGSGRTSSFGMSKSPQRIRPKKDGLPGPATYNTTVYDKASGISIHFTKSQRKEVFETVVNDATVQSLESWVRKPSKSPVFASITTRELQFEIPETPGPDTYHITSKKKKTPKVSTDFGLDRRTYEDPRHDNPGPADYSANLPKSARKLSTIPKGERKPIWKVSESQIELHLPPTSIKVGSESARQPSSSSRDILTNRETNPGPAAYFAEKPKPSSARTISRSARFRKNEYIGGIKTSKDYRSVESHLELELSSR